jgi:hypothetical protein
MVAARTICATPSVVKAPRREARVPKPQLRLAQRVRLCLDWMLGERRIPCLLRVHLRTRTRGRRAVVRGAAQLLGKVPSAGRGLVLVSLTAWPTPEDERTAIPIVSGRAAMPIAGGRAAMRIVSGRAAMPIVGGR